MLLDSNIIIHSAKREYAELRTFLNDIEYSVSAISLVEVLGYHAISDAEKKYLRDFFAAANVLPISQSVIREAVSLRQQKRISVADAIVAGTAVTHLLTLVTRNVSDFGWIQTMPILNPFDSSGSRE